MDQNKIREILNQIRQLDGGMGTSQFWQEIDDLLAGAELKIEYSARPKKEGFVISLDTEHHIGVYEFMQTFFRRRRSNAGIESTQIFNQHAARELYYEVMVELLDQAA